MAVGENGGIALQRDGADADEIRKELAAILASGSFRGSKRCHDFLEHVVTRALQGDVDSLKERTLAVEIFGRKATADLGDDSIVRVGAREVRKRLAQYYNEEGTEDRIRIELPPGSYVPAFRRRAGVRERHDTVSPPASPAAPVQPRRSRRRWIAVVAPVVLAAVAVSAWRFSQNGAERVESFWQPALAAQSPVLAVMAHPIVYHPSARATDLDKERNGPPDSPLQRPIQLPPELLSGADFVPVLDQYVGFGDAVTAARLSAFCASHGKSLRVRMATKVDFADMRDSASILIGAYTNRWTSEIAKDLRYRFGFVGNKPCITDSASGKEWTLVHKADNGQANEDYIVIARLIHGRTGRFVVIGAGLTQYGTQEAGRILADPSALQGLLRALPSGWEKNNVEFVLHAQVLGDTPAAPETVAQYQW